MRKASTGMPEQGTQTPSPAPDLIPATTENQLRTYTEIGAANGGTSAAEHREAQWGGAFCSTARDGIGSHPVRGQ
jgi:hypothetical protein